MSLSSTYLSRKALLAEKLNERGVTASASDGLTTLINKIDDIPLGADVLTISVDKSVVSYYDSESATVTCLLVNANNQPLPNKEISISVVHGSTTIDTDTITTDSDGEATYTYASSGVGDVTISASYGILLEETYVRDTLFYDKCNSDKTSEYTLSNNGISISFDTDHYLLSKTGNGWGDCIHSVPTVTNFKFEFDVYFPSTSSINLQFWCSLYNSSNNGYGCHLSVPDNRITVRKGTYTDAGTNTYVSQSFTRDKWYHIEFIVENGNLTANLYDGDTIVNTVSLTNSTTYSDVNTMNLRCAFGSSTRSIKNIEITAL